jgi:ribosomal-protein-alanine N-acetyltransferase
MSGAASGSPLIRRLGVFDLPLLAALHARCFTAAWDQDWPATSFAEILAMPGAGGWLISDGKDPQGFILTRQVLDEMEIILIGIDPVYRRHGIAGRLLDFTLNEASRTGVKTVFLEQAAPNAAAQGLYLGRGFQPVGRRAGYYRNREGAAVDAVILRRDLVA